MYGCGFEFKADKTFIFSDRCCLYTGYSEGTWDTVNNLLIIKSYKKFGDFEDIFDDDKDISMTNVDKKFKLDSDTAMLLSKTEATTLDSSENTYYWHCDSNYIYHSSGESEKFKKKKIYKFPFNDTSYEFFNNIKFYRLGDTLQDINYTKKGCGILMRRVKSNR